jgi:hypothetical protein
VETTPSAAVQTEESPERALPGFEPGIACDARCGPPGGSPEPGRATTGDSKVCIAALGRLAAAFFTRKGKAYSFRFKDWTDYRWQQIPIVELRVLSYPDAQS